MVSRLKLALLEAFPLEFRQLLNNVVICSAEYFHSRFSYCRPTRPTFLADSRTSPSTPAQKRNSAASLERPQEERLRTSTATNRSTQNSPAQTASAGTTGVLSVGDEGIHSDTNTNSGLSELSSGKSARRSAFLFNFKLSLHRSDFFCSCFIALLI